MENKCKAVREVTFECSSKVNDCKNFENCRLFDGECRFYHSRTCSSHKAQAEALAELEGEKTCQDTL